MLKKEGIERKYAFLANAETGISTGGFHFPAIGIPGTTAIWYMSLFHHKREVLV
jgi:hypothetical protein